MAQDKFKVSNPGGMWLRKQPLISEDTKIVLLPLGHLVTKLADTDKPDWWRVSTTFADVDLKGFSNKNLMSAVPDTGAVPVSSAISSLLNKTLAALRRVAPNAHPNYLDAIRGGAQLFERHGIKTPLRMAHFLAQAMQETGSFTVLRENMSYSTPRMLEIFGQRHSAKVTPAEAPGLARNPEKLSERVYGLGNPRKARELGNTRPGDGFRYRGNGVLQTTGRDAHRRMGLACGLDFEGHPELLTDPEHALKPALQEWTEGNLNIAADRNDIRAITLRINGGLNGFAERQAFFNRLLPLLRGDS